MSAGANFGVRVGKPRLVPLNRSSRREEALSDARNSDGASFRRLLRGSWAGVAFALGTILAGLGTTALAAQKTNAVLVELEGQVSVSRANSQAWDPAHTNQVLFPGDRIRTMDRSRAVVQLSDLSTLRLGPQSFVLIPAERRGLNLLRGFLYYFHRDKPGTLPVQTPSSYAVILGTEFALQVDDNGATRLTLIDGKVELTNEFDGVSLSSGEAATAQRNAAPVKVPALEAVNVIQWALYYPGVLDLEELPFTPAEVQALNASLTAYRSGDLIAAVTNYPVNRQPASEAEKVYFAGLNLAVGQVDPAQAVLDTLPSAESKMASLVNGLRTVIAAVKFRPHPGPLPQEKGNGLPSTATELLAESYHAQSRADLEQALAFARRATEASPNFSFAWARVAELEFSFGRIDPARGAADKSLQLAPRNAHAIALRGFFFAARNRTGAAIAAFDEAIALNGAMGNAWLGRGLCRIRRGDLAGGREDLQVAATVEPQRAILRSYLGKAFSGEGDVLGARKELRLAKSLDSGDPTAWLYSALLNREVNRINEAVRDLEHARELNQNRRVFRSGLLVEQDRAVQGVNLAGLYADAGMLEVSAREAGRAVEADPSNYSAHQFLGDSYQRLRDPTRISQRFETPAITEYLLANLLSPVGAGTLAQSVTQNEYSKLFERDGLGVSSTTEYYSRGAWIQSGAQYGTFKNLDYAVSGFYNSDQGQRANNDLEQSEVSLQLKLQITPADSLYFRAIQGQIEGGDLAARPDPATANRTLRVEEHQEPLLLAGYHREWSPGMHTLALVGWLSDELRITNGQRQTLLLGKNNNGAVSDAVPISIEQQFQTSVEFFTAELQQLWQLERHTLIVGGRYQAGSFDTRNRDVNADVPPPIPGFVSVMFPRDRQRIESDFERASGYGYYHWRPVAPLMLIAGMSYDWLRSPVNFRYAPLDAGEESTHQISPKGGIVWTPTERTTLRAAYSQSLGGVGFDQSFRLEPSQVAGFNQSFRSIIPESVAGANSGAGFETWNASFEQRFGRNTYLGLSGEWLHSEVERVFGVYDFLQPFKVLRSSTRQRLDYDEQTLLLTLNQLVGDEWAFGARYRLSHAELESNFRNIPDSALTLLGFKPRTRSDGLLHQVNLFAIYNDPSGFFTQAEALWNAQSTDGDTTPADNDFWQFNLFGGWRGFQRRFEVRVGILNITGEDYRLNPLNLTAELPRERTFVARMKFNF